VAVSYRINVSLIGHLGFQGVQFVLVREAFHVNYPIKFKKSVYSVN